MITIAEQLMTKIRNAKQEMEDAERDLERLLLDLRVFPRPEKTTITPVLEAAFTKLRNARKNLVELELLLEGDAEVIPEGSS